LDEVCATADYLTLHMPSTPETKNLFNDERFAKCKQGIRIVNTARGELIDEAALQRAIESGRVAGAGLDVFQKEPPVDWGLAQLAKVVATPHLAASTDELQRLQPWIKLADALTTIASQMGGATRVDTLGLRYYGALADSRGTDILASSAAAGLLRPILSGGVSVINARAAARERGIEIVETRSSRPRHFTSLVSVKLHTSEGERWAEGTVFAPNSPRLVSVRGIDVEAPLAGTMLIIANDDQPGVIGEVGTILGTHGVNIANFALGRGEGGAVGVVNVDENANSSLDAAVEAIRKVAAVKQAWVVRL
jgi:D-3-phosphoglycerate dehydrogenase